MIIANLGTVFGLVVKNFDFIKDTYIKIELT